ncbi:cytochrome c mitochondrial import factor (Cyc2) [Ascosphaera apis ARSEF 7405]|uniref:Cytochrome c mitochondrial import factor (Cyc2) n=1 Tax=Ascosphaera apis ARSEF 7405 TaxID=392613 RepID=A0A168DN73_9EURO|nr:cytochrome c mitochondrial import factor (Cyc2) [Ascosphaera apis ARSEF 7405]
MIPALRQVSLRRSSAVAVAIVSRTPRVCDRCLSTAARSIEGERVRRVGEAQAEGKTSASSSQPQSRTQKSSRRWLALLAVTGLATYGGYRLRRKQRLNATAQVDPTTHFMTYEIVSRHPVTSTSSILTLKTVGPHSKRLRQLYEEATNRGCWSLFFKQPFIQIGRSYTPLPPKVLPAADETASQPMNDDEFTVRFLVRDLPYGEMSRYLQSLSVGSQVEVRGPEMMDFDVPKETSELLFIAGGTGIAPALQATYTLLSRAERERRAGSRPNENLRVRILWANRRREDCQGGTNDHVGWKDWLLGSSKKNAAKNQGDLPEHLVVRYINQLKEHFPGSLTVDYFVDEEGSHISASDILRFTQQSPHSDKERAAQAPSGKKLILVAGPPGFVSHMAGPPLIEGGATFMQGPVKGIIGQLNLPKEWLVWKL